MKLRFRRLILASLRFHWRSHVGVILGATVGAAALTGALVVGDSVRESLKERAEARLGAAAFAIDSGDRLFRLDLGVQGNFTSPLPRPGAGERRLVWGSSLDRAPWTAHALHVRGTVSRQDGSARAHEVQIYGATSNFWAFGPAATRERSETGLGAMAPPLSPSALPAYQKRLEDWQRPEPGRVRLNQALAQQLEAQPGDVLILRFSKPSALSQDAVLGARNESTAALRLVVDEIVSPEDFGDFSLQAGQRPARNAFVNLAELWAATGTTNQANLLLAQAGEWRRSLPAWVDALRRSLAANMNRLPAPLFRPLYRTISRLGSTEAESQATEKYLANALQLAWRLEDAQINVRLIDPPPGPPESAVAPMVEVATPRVFLGAAVVTAATRPDPNLPAADQQERGWMTNGVRILTYLANALQAGDRLTPYSMVAAVGPPWTPADLADDEIVINDWLARDLALGPGDSLNLVYFDPEAGARLLERTNTFRVRSVVPLQGRYADRTLMPEFPGLANAESTTDWDAGFPLEHRIREQDEAYWHDHRGTPKAFVSEKAGRALWGNRFGDTTAVRHFVPDGTLPEAFRMSVAANLRANLRPTDVGLVFQPVRQLALQAATSGQDFGQLFLGFSFFLVLAALLLMSLLFRFGLEQRLPEIGTLLALGFRPRTIRWLWLGEGMALAFCGGCLGLLGGVFYAQAMIGGLSTLWRAAVGGAVLDFHVTLTTLAVGLIASVIVSGFTLWLSLRRQFLRPARALLSGEIEGPRPARRRSRGLWLGLAAALAAAGLIAGALVQGETANPGVFFGAGSLVLIAGIAFTAAWLGRGPTSTRRQPAGQVTHAGSESAAVSADLQHFTRTGLAVRGTTRRRSRSLATATLLACGTFLIASLGVFRMDAARDAWRRSSGTGGFALIGETSLPVVKDLNTAEGLESFGLSPQDLPGVRFVPFRVHDGDDASCLNLNRAQRPRILGVDPQALAQRGAFTFAQLAPGITATNGWQALAETLPQPAPPLADPAVSRHPPMEYAAIGDAASIQWALGSRVGGTLELTTETGYPFHLRLIGGVANSLLQGNLVVSEKSFQQLYPGDAGYRFFLIDAPTNAVAEVSATLSRALEDAGIQLTPAARRLAEFNAVQNTYLTTFQVLGGLGLLLGSAGLGVVVLRNVLERRGELALLTAVGFRHRTLGRLILLEHGALLAAGLAIGLVSAAVAVLPSVLSPQAGLPLGSLIPTLVGVLVLGLVTAWTATRWALRGPLLEALRGE